MLKALVLGIVALMAVGVVAEATMDVYAPSGRRWPVFTGMELPLVSILDENGYYATLACTVGTFDNEAHTYTLNCGDAPTVIQVGK